jgi:GTPase SAR1 family protein
MKEDKFFDRKVYLEILEKRIMDLKDGYRQNIAFVGDELVGKTSLIFKFLNSFYDNRFIIVYLETRPESLDSFSKRFIGVLLYDFLLPSEISLKEDLDFLLNKASDYIPKTVEKIKLILSELQKNKKENIFTELLSLPEIINKETNKFCVVIFDEFHNLERLGIKNLYKEWSQLLIVQKSVMYIIISSMQFKTKNILSKDLCLLFGNFQVITVEPFDIRTTEEYLEHELKDLNIDVGLKNFTVHFTGGQPFYLEIITDALSRSKSPNLVDILQDLLFDYSGILNQKFSNYLKRFQESSYSHDYISILHLISNGQNKIKDIAHILHRTKKEIDVRVNYLSEIDAISRSGDFLRINDRVFGFWLKFVYQEKLQSLTFDSSNQKMLFRKNMENMIQEFLSNADKPVTQRLTELLRLFADERIQIDRKKLKLNHFREIKPLEFNKKGIKEGLICRSNESLWIFALKYDLLTEDDISEFSLECKKYRHKLQRKIIITLRDMDPNSRLKALEEKIWTWDLNNLNLILDLFSKPRIIA